MPPKRRRVEEEVGTSLLIRPATNTLPRRKACLQCFEAKIRCDHKRPVCSRCMRRAIACDYSGAASSDAAPTRESTSSASIYNPHLFPSPTRHSPSTQYARREELSNALALPPHLPSLSLPSADIPLLCTVDAERVRDRWLEGWVPRPGQQTKNLSRGTAIFIHSILKTYPQLLCKGDLPPIIHGLQVVGGMLPEALANCASIVRMWEGERENGSEIVRETTVREMERLVTEKQEHDQYALLAAFQAYVMYVTLLVNPSVEPVVPQSIMLTLQSFAYTLALTGLIHPSETRSPSHASQPPWTHWALAEAKRRSLFAMYMLDDVVNAFSNIPCILGDELSDLPAPCSEKLWRASEEGIWRRLYEVHIAEWEGGGLKLNELWPRTGEKDRRRVGRWVRDMDSFGMVIFAVTTGTQY